jgi:hypothetical protein
MSFPAQKRGCVFANLLLAHTHSVAALSLHDGPPLIAPHIAN